MTGMIIEDLIKLSEAKLLAIKLKRPMATMAEIIIYLPPYSSTIQNATNATIMGIW